jgi:protein Tex
VTTQTTAQNTAGSPTAKETTLGIIKRIAAELGVRDHQVTAAVELLDGGATVPFIARYRKEATGTLDDAQLRTLDERLRYLRELDERRTAILASIDEQGKLTDELRAQIDGADTKARLEDLYLPYKPKRRTKAQIARENGLEPLADLLLGTPATDPREAAEGYLNENVADVAAALDGARAILVERFAEDADLIGQLRERMWAQGSLVAKVREGKAEEGKKYSDYFDFAEPFGRLKAHRVLAMFRAEKEEVLDLTLNPNDEGFDAIAGTSLSASYEQPIADRFGIQDHGWPADKWLTDTVRWAWRTRVLVHLGIDLRMRLWQSAEAEAVDVFAANLRDLLLAAPAGQRATMGLDPGFRTGVKVAVIDQTGKPVATHTIYPHVPQNKWDESLAILANLAEQHHVDLIAIGNGTASRETDKLAIDLIKANPELNLTKIVVSEAGASVYSASAYASAELPEMDVSLRGAVSIARRLQDPLAELVKIDPKSIGVGQYQHDVTGTKLERSLDAVVEDAVNAVGVDVNTASKPLLARVSGITDSLATAIVAHRDDTGAFATREHLRDVPRLGPKAFEQAAGFLRIQGGDNPLDASGVHPEAYPVVRRILEKTQEDVGALIGDTKTLRGLNPTEFTDEAFGLPTVNDILKELEKPGRDPRPEFQTATFADGVHTLGDLEPGMILEGVVTNVAAFGAFVDIGVHQDGLVHVSALSKNFVSDPHDVVKSGDVVQVKVLSVDIPRHRISLTMRTDDPAEGAQANPRSARGPRPGAKSKSQSSSRTDPGSTPQSAAPTGAAGPDGDLTADPAAGDAVSGADGAVAADATGRRSGPGNDRRAGRSGPGGPAGPAGPGGRGGSAGRSGRSGPGGSGASAGRSGSGGSGASAGRSGPGGSGASAGRGGPAGSGGSAGPGGSDGSAGPGGSAGRSGPGGPGRRNGPGSDRPGRSGAGQRGSSSGPGADRRDGGAGAADGRGGGSGPDERRGAPGSSGNRHGTGAGAGHDRRGSGSGPGADRRGGAPGAGADRRGSGSGDRRTPPPPTNPAMAEALRRAGLLNDAGKPANEAPADRRSGRP